MLMDVIRTGRMHGDSICLSDTRVRTLLLVTHTHIPTHYALQQRDALAALIKSRANPNLCTRVSVCVSECESVSE